MIGNWAMYRQDVDTQEQQRFEYDSLDKLGNFSKEFNCFADAVPDLSLSLQWDSQTQTVRDFDYYLNIIKSRL